MPTISTNAGTFFYEAPSAKVFLADDLIEDNLVGVDPDNVDTSEPFLYVDRLRIAAAPEIDVCEMHYIYGHQLREGATAFATDAPLDIVGKFVKVVIEDTVAGSTLDPIEWYGKIEHVEQEVYGQRNGAPFGVQKFTAFGLLRLLEKVIIDRSFVANAAGDDILEVQAALPFNLDAGGEYPTVGNFQEVTVGANIFPVFSNQQVSGTKWSAADAVEYLLKRFTPKNSLDDPANVWTVDPLGDIQAIAAWFEFTVDCELKSTKDILDELLNRRRGLSYYIRCAPQTDTSQPNNIYLVPFSFNETDISMPSGVLMEANPNQYTLDFENALDVVEAKVSDVATAKYHRVRVYGEFITSTFTIGLSTTLSSDYLMLLQAWSAADEAEFLAAAGGDALENAAFRAVDYYRKVFSEFIINEDWNQQVFPNHEPSSTFYLACPKIEEGDAVIDPVYNLSNNPSGETLWLPGLQICRHLPLHNHWDYGGTNIEDGTSDAGLDPTDRGFVPVLAYIRTYGTDNLVWDANGDVVADPPFFEQVEKLNHKAFDDTDGRSWACHVGVLDHPPGMSVLAHPQQMLAEPYWAGAGTTDESQDPTQMNGLDWANIFFTLTVQVQKRVQASKDISGQTIAEPILELPIYVPNARLDYVVPYTTVRIDDGKPIPTTSGGAVRDDRFRLSDIATAAAQWYGTDRRTLSLTYKQVRNLFTLGWLITDIGASYSPTGINTPVTALEYRFGKEAPTTTVETSFAALDFVT